ncbi:MAG: hypothetical protein IPL40_04120 [Proteobacteria bacterium]|nr:hypothetical protein [Pseudomonadota bacterium]
MQPTPWRRDPQSPEGNRSRLPPLRRQLALGVALTVVVAASASPAQDWGESAAEVLTTADDPPLPRAIAAALGRADLPPAATLSWRQRARWAATLPRLTARLQHARGLAQYVDLRSEVPDRFDASARVGWRVDLALSWELGAICFAERELQVQRALAELESARRTLAARVVELYAERRRLRATLRAATGDPEGEARAVARFNRAGALLAALCGDQLFPSAGNRR